MKRIHVILLMFIALISVGAVVADRTAEHLFFDRYAGQPQVVGIPAGAEPIASEKAYTGPHPAISVRAADPFDYPIKIGETGPVKPTYLRELQYPYACRTEVSGLGQPLVDNQQGAGVAVYEQIAGEPRSDVIIGYSKDCSLATHVRYYHLDAASGMFVAHTGDASGVAQIAVAGTTVPFIVRLEIGTINRHIYVIATLRGPDDGASNPDMRYWNGKLVYQFRGGVGIGRRQGRIEPFYIPDRRRAELARGYAIAYSTANQTANHYDINLAEDTVARVKRHFAARYGEPIYTLGIGKSGGAIQQYLIGQNRPGLLDGGIAIYGYPDMITQTTRIMDCELLEYYFDVTAADNPKWRTWRNRSWIEGFNARDDLPNIFRRIDAVRQLINGNWPAPAPGHTECTKSWRTLMPQIANPGYNYFSSLYADDVAQRVRWTYWDNLPRVFGTDEHGFARRTWDNVGVQYGLAALKSGKITSDEFFHLNASIGGWKPSSQMQPERYWRFASANSELSEMSIWSHHNMTHAGTFDKPAARSEGDLAAIAAAYRSGQVFIGRIEMPIIDVRHYLEPELDMHHSAESLAARLRMLRGQGHADNQLIWMTRPPANLTTRAFDVLERWLDNIHSGAGASVADSKPGDATDRCYDAGGKLIAEGPAVWDGAWNGKKPGPCLSTYPPFGNPRIVAGDGYSGHIFKCHLQSVDEAISRELYAPVDMRPHRAALGRVFPQGVCDYRRGDLGWPPELSALTFSNDW